MKFVNIGFGNVVMAQRVVSMVSPDSAPLRRARNEAKKKERLIDATHGRPARTMIFTDTNYIILSALNPETLLQRFEERKGLK